MKNLLLFINRKVSHVLFFCIFSHWGIDVNIPKDFKKISSTPHSVIFKKDERKIVIVYWKGKEFSLPFYERAFSEEDYKNIGVKGRVIFAKKEGKKNASLFIFLTEEREGIIGKRYILRAEVFPYKRDEQITLLVIYKDKEWEKEAFSIIEGAKVH